MTTVTHSTTTPASDGWNPTRLAAIRYEVGYNLGGQLITLAERLRMLGQKVSGDRPTTDEADIRSTYDWGFRIGRDQALRTLVGDAAAKAVVRATWNEEAR